jgi:hypothetical protein
MNQHQKINQHFIIKINGVEYVYVYIRKNACSAWKKVFFAESEHQSEVNKSLGPLEFMNRFHRASTIDKVLAVEKRIVILRDPIVRVHSAFINQIVMRMDRQYSLHESIEEFIGKPIGRLTFADFVNNYLVKIDIDEIDGHFQPQSCTLLDIEYSHVWDLSNLYRNSIELFGAKFADRHFAKKVNSTARLMKSSESAWNAKIREISKVFINKNMVPDISSLITPEIAERLRIFYKQDYQLLNEYGLGNLAVDFDIFRSV